MIRSSGWTHAQCINQVGWQKQHMEALQADSNEMNGRQLVPAHFPTRVPLTKAIHGVTVDPNQVVA